MSSTNERPSQRAEATPATGKSLRLSPVPVERFDEYVVVARLGQGGMAEVILGLAQGPQGFRKLVAIKRLHAHCEEDAEQLRMFLHEASLAALFAHPNVVQTHKVGAAEGRHFIAMEYLEGQPLHRALPRLRGGGAGLDPVLAALIASEVLAGLEHVHEASGYDGMPLGLVHRDVSPQNVFITYDGQVKLLDFGIAKAVALAGHTRPGLIKGKLGYIAPEQARGRADRRADLWSVGVVLWEALTGARLFRGEDQVAVLRAVLSAEVPPLRALDPDLPEALERVVERALAREPSQRYASAAEMRHELDAWLRGQQALAGDADGTSAQASARAALAQAMQVRFSDAITERRAAVLECLAAIEHEQRWLSVTQSGFDPARSSAPPAEPRPPAQRRGFSRAAAIGGILLVVGLLVALGTASRASQLGNPATRQQRVSELSLAGTVAAPSALRAQAPAPQRASVAPERAVAADPGAVAAASGSAPYARSPRAARASEDARPLRLGADGEAAGPAPSGSVHGRHGRTRVSPPAPVLADSAAAPGASPALGDAAERGLAGEEAAPARPPLPAQPATGRLRLEATPYAVVSLDGQRLGITPIDVELPAQAHTLTLRNPERGIETTYRVQVIANESVLRRVELE